MKFEISPTNIPEKKVLDEQEPVLLSEEERTGVAERVSKSEERRLANNIPESNERKNLYRGAKEVLNRKVVILTISLAAGIGAVAEKMDTTQERIEQSSQLSAEYSVLKSELFSCFPKGTQACYKAIDNLDRFLVANNLDDTSRKIASSALRATIPILLYPN